LTHLPHTYRTIFSPLAQAKNLAGGARLLSHIRLHPGAVLMGLTTIMETTRRFVEASLATGVDGIFYAVQHAQASLLGLEEYRMFGLPFDQQVLAPAREAWCNMLHLHGRDIYFELAAEYPVQMVNWHDRETAPSLTAGISRFHGAVCGGLRQDSLVFGNAVKVRQEALSALAQTSGSKHILSTGCVVPVIAPYGNILAARRSVDPSFGQTNGTGAHL
jgi:uroporphyrinogen decarboxylase